MHTVKPRKHLAVWVSPETHARFSALAASAGMPIACLLGELVDEALDAADVVAESPPTSTEARPDRIGVRLRPGDAAALRKRAGLRRMKPSTYVAALVRSHLVEDPPLPKAELATLERATAEVSAVGRNLNQIARAINAGAPVPVETTAVIDRSIEAVESARQAAKAYVRVAIASWEAPLG
ncbi:MAG: plasmid mobilization relaxosome protein MobC [Cyanobacteria bacterium SZAS LIN-2]|nr:plasmid mobilization relaxosome protein MobC [Cyanobacteria bacterium SZAS LIN-2]